MSAFGGGVAEEDRAALLGHSLRTMPEHYASADVGRLVALANRVLDRVGTRTILRVANAACLGRNAVPLWTTSRAKVAQLGRGSGFELLTA